MKYCNDCDIAYEERNCPLCEAKNEINDLEGKIDLLEEKRENKQN